MEQPKNPRDASDGGSDRLSKRPRSENGPPSLFAVQTQTRPPGNFGADSFSATPSQPASIFDYSPSSSSFLGGATATTPNLFGTPSNQSNIFGHLAPARNPFGFCGATASSTNPSQGMDESELDAGLSTAPGSVSDLSEQASSGAPAHQQNAQQDASDSEYELDTMADVNEEENEPFVAPQIADPIKQEEGENSAATDAPANITPAPLPISVEVLDPRGDLSLLAGQPGVMFRVCSRSLARSSPVWDAMLFGPFSEGKEQQDDDDEGWTVRLPDDNPDSLRILLNAVHSKFDAIPTTLPNESVFSLAVLCDKYDTVALLKPFWNDWVQKSNAAPSTPTGFVHRLWIARTLGYERCYKATLKELIYLLRILNDKPRIFLESYYEEDLCDNIYLQALGVLEHLKTGRLVLLREAGAKLKNAMQNLTNRKGKPFLCRSEGGADWQRICDCAMLGAAHRTLHDKTWYHSGEQGWEERVTVSVRHLVVKMQGVRTAIVEESGMVKRKGGHHHKDCAPWADITLANVLEGHEVKDLVPIDEGYLQRQKAKSGAVELSMMSNFFGREALGMFSMYRD